MKPRVKNDSWFYTTSTTSARRKVKRLTRKRHRDSDRRLVKEGINSL